MHMRIAKL